MLVVISTAMKTCAALQLENIALHHQIGVLQRSAKKRLPLNNADRLLWIGLSRVWTEWRSALKILRPDSVIGWHREGLSHVLELESSSRPARTPVAATVNATAVFTIFATVPRIGSCPYKHWHSADQYPNTSASRRKYPCVGTDAPTQ